MRLDEAKPFAPAARRLEVDAVNHRIRAHQCGQPCDYCSTAWINYEPARPYSREARALAWQLQHRLGTHHHHVLDALAAADGVAA